MQTEELRYERDDRLLSETEKAIDKVTKCLNHLTSGMVKTPYSLFGCISYMSNLCVHCLMLHYTDSLETTRVTFRPLLL